MRVLGNAGAQGVDLSRLLIGDGGGLSFLRGPRYRGVVEVSLECEGFEECGSVALSMARRGREDFEHQAAYGDYTAEDRAAADRLWLLAETVGRLLAGEAQKA